MGTPFIYLHFRVGSFIKFIPKVFPDSFFMAHNQIVNPDLHLLAYFTELFFLFEERGSAKLTKCFIHLYTSPFILLKSDLGNLKNISLIPLSALSCRYDTCRFCIAVNEKACYFCSIFALLSRRNFGRRKPVFAKLRTDKPVFVQRTGRYAVKSSIGGALIEAGKH